MINNYGIIAEVVKKLTGCSVECNNFRLYISPVVGVPNSDDKEISLILGIYQLDKTHFATLISIGHRL